VLKFLATDPKVKALLSRPSNGRNPLLGHCAVSNPIFTQAWHIHQDSDRTAIYSLAQLQLCCAYARSIDAANTLPAFERAIARGAEFVPGGHPAYDACLSMRFLCLRSPEATDLLDLLPVTARPADYVDAMLDVSPPNWSRSIERFYPLLSYLYKLQTGKKYVRRTVIRVNGSGGATWVANEDGVVGGTTTVLGDAEDTTHGAITLTRVGDEQDDPGAVKAALDADVSPVELNGGDDLYLCGEAKESPSTHDRIRLANYSRTQMRALGRPTHLLAWAENLLSLSELRPLLDRALTACSRAAVNELCCVLLAIVSLFISRSFEQVAALKVFPPHARNSHADLAIFLAEDNSGATDYWRLSALRPPYKTIDADLGDKAYRPSDYVLLPLPRIIGQLVRVLLKARSSNCEKDSAITLFPTASKKLFRTTRELLTQIDPDNRLTAHRIQRTLFQNIVIASGGDVALAALTLATDLDNLAAVELFYDGVLAEEAIAAYSAAVAEIEQYCLPGLISMPRIPSQASVYIGCRYTPRIEAVIKEVGRIQHEAFELARFSQVHLGDPAFERAFNYCTLLIVWWYGYACGARAGVDPVLHISRVNEETGLATWSDKDDLNGYKRKLVWIPPDLYRALAYLEQYTAKVRRQISNPQCVKGHTTFFLVDGLATPVSPKSIGDLTRDFWPFPANTHRRVMKQELRRVNCPPATIRSWAGWSIAEQEFWNDSSSLSFQSLRDEYEYYIPPLLHRLGFGLFERPEGR
jgi:hypothetical protein